MILRLVTDRMTYKNDAKINYFWKIIKMFEQQLTRAAPEKSMMFAH